MTVLITLTTVGADTGPTFDLYSDVDGYTAAFETEVPKASLQAGYTSTVVPDGTTIIKVVSHEGVCVNTLFLTLETTTTTTSTSTTTTTTTIPVYGDTYYDSYPPTDEGTGSNPRTNYWSSHIIGDSGELLLDVELTATEVANIGGSGQIFISVDPNPDFSLKVWNAIIGFGGTNPYPLSFFATTDVYFMVIAGSSPGDYTEMEVEITSTSMGAIGTPYILTLTSTTGGV